MPTAAHSTHVYQVRARKDRCGIDLMSDALPLSRLGYDTSDHAIDYAMHYSRSTDAVIRVYDDAGDVMGTRRGRIRPPVHPRNDKTTPARLPGRRSVACSNVACQSED